MIFYNIFRNINSKYLLTNPIILSVFILSCCSTYLLIEEFNYSGANITLYLQIVFWMWMTLIFAASAESYAESFYKKKFIQHKKAFNSSEYAVIHNINHPDQIQHIKKEDIKKGDIILLKNSEIAPHDCKIISGKAYVNETDITGTFGLIKKGTSNNIIYAGSFIEASENLIVQIQSTEKLSIPKKLRSNFAKIQKHTLPSEAALQKLVLCLSILFSSITLTIWVISGYMGAKIPPIYFFDLIIVLLPTTISGLQTAIITYSRARLAKKGIEVHDFNALDNIVDINIALIDKTGTITQGKREMIGFHNLSNLSEQKLLHNIYLSSYNDKTKEGESIKQFAIKKLPTIEKLDIDSGYKYLPFSFAKPLSGCDYKNIEIRKGSIKAICKYLNCNMSDLNTKTLDLIKEIAASHGTALLFTIGQEIVAVLHLRDLFRSGIKRKIEKLYEHNIEPILVTGDNDYSASYVAEKVGIKKYYADSAPERKLQLVQELQEQGFIVAMCGDGANDTLALAQSDVGLAFVNESENKSNVSADITTVNYDISMLLELRNVCKKMTVKRGALTIFSLSSDIAKYFVIVPALFTTVFPALSAINFMNFHSLSSVMLASIMFNALIILALIPFLFMGFNKRRSKYSLWQGASLYLVIGIISPFLGIKLLETLILNLGLV